MNSTSPAVQTVEDMGFNKITAQPSPDSHSIHSVGQASIAS